MHARSPSRPLPSILLLLLCCVLPATATATAQKAKIAILLWHETRHDIAAMEGFLQGMELSGLPFEVDIQRAHGNPASAKDILATFKRQKPDLIVTISTRATQLAATTITDIPIVFTAVTNPVSAGIVSSWQGSGTNITGTSNWISAQEMLTAFLAGLPGTRSLGALYNPANPVSRAELAEMRLACRQQGITLITGEVSQPEQLVPAADRLLGQGIDTLWLPREKLLYQNMQLLSPLLLRHGIPAVSSTMEALTAPNSPAIIALLADYTKLGRLCVPLVIDILEHHRAAGTIPIARLPRHLTIVNANAGLLLNRRLPPLFLATADTILTGYAGQEITVAGSGDSQALLRELARAMASTAKGGIIHIPESSGSSGGIRALLAGHAELARVSRPLTGAEQKAGLVFDQFAISPVVFVTNAWMTGVESLTTSQILAIYSGAITDWQELGGPPGKIYPIMREPGDSALRAIRKVLPDFAATAPAARTFYTTPKTVEALERHRRTLGYLPLAAAKGRKVRILKINGKTPSAANIADGAYPMIMPLAFAYQRPLTGLAKGFVAFTHSDQGRRLITSLGALPFTP